MDNLTVFASVVSVIVSVIAIAVSYYSFQRTFKTGIRPVLIFSHRPDGLWQIQNVGNGPAVSLIVGDMDWQDRWRIIANCYPMAAGATTILPWLKHGKGLAAVYTDINGASFTTLCRENRNELSESNKFPQWIATQEEWLLTLARDKDNNSTLTQADLIDKSTDELEEMRNEIYARHSPDDRELASSKFSVTEKYEMHLIRDYQMRNNLTRRS